MSVCSQPCLSYCISYKENAMNHTQNSWHQHTGSPQWHLEQGLDKAPKHLLQILSSKEHAKCLDTHQADWSQNQKRFQFNFLPWEIVFVEPSKTSSSNMFFSFCFCLCCSDLRVPCLRVTIQHTLLLRFHCYILCVLGIPCTRSWASLNPWCSFERFKLWASFQTSKLETLWIGKYLLELWGEFWEAQVGTYTQLMKCPHRSLQLVILAEMQACLVSRPLDSGMPSQNHMQRAAKNNARY